MGYVSNFCERSTFTKYQFSSLVQYRLCRSEHIQYSKENFKIMKEELRGEGGSDVFSSTRHVNPNANYSSNDFKMKFWSNDDAPIIRPLLKTQPSSVAKEISMGVNHNQADGYGGIACKKITKISGRSQKQWIAAYAALILSGTAVFGLLVKYKKPKIA